MSKPEGGEQLRTVIVAALNAMAGDLCAKINRSTSDMCRCGGGWQYRHAPFVFGIASQTVGLAPTCQPKARR